MFSKTHETWLEINEVVHKMGKGEIHPKELEEFTNYINQ